MVQILPFDLLGSDDYTLDTLLEEDDDDVPFDDAAEAERQRQLERAQDEKARLMDEITKSVQELTLFVEISSKDSSLDMDDSSRTERDRIKKRNQELCKIRDQIKKQDMIASTIEFELLESQTKKTSCEIKQAIKEQEIERVHRTILAAEAVDLAFVIDGTSSMAPYIENVKNSIREMVTKVRRTNPNLNLHLAVVIYRDFSDTQRFQVLDFVTDIHQFEQFLGSIESVGGDDAPEDMAGGIQKANELGWTNLTRVVFLIADAPCHGTEFHTLEDDKYPSGTPDIDIEHEMRNLMANSGRGTMSVFFGRLTKHTDGMIARFNECGLPMTVVDTKYPQEVTNAIARAVRSSIFKTITTRSATDGRAFSLASVSFDAAFLLKNSAGGIPQASNSDVKLKPYCVIPRLPSIAEWTNQPATLVKVYKNTPIASMQDLRKPLRVGVIKYLRSLLQWEEKEQTEKESTMVLRRSAAPFAEGSMRLAFHGQLARTEDELSLDKSKVVMKTFKQAGKELNGLKRYLQQMELSNIANFLAKEYNRQRSKSSGNVYILTSCVVEEEEEVNEGRGSRRFTAEEPLPTVPTSFTKFCNNTGYWDADELHETLLCFAHFTYSASKEYLMVADLQGVQVGSDFYLTDPVILCTDVSRFGHTNLGKKFLKKSVDATNHLLTENGWEKTQ